MDWVYQGKGTRLCGQACVAMIAGITLDEAVKLFGTKGGTRTKHVVDAFNKLGVKTGKLTRVSKKNKKTDLCMVVIHYSFSNRKHWTIWNKDKYYDPSIGVLTEYPLSVRETSFLPVYK